MPVLADVGMMGGRDTHQFSYLTEYGEDTCLLCPKCGYAADSEVAAFVKEPQHAEEEPKALEEIDTPGQKTIADLAAFLGVPESRTAKAVFYEATLRSSQEPVASSKQDERLVREPIFVAIRGDMDVNEAKLRNALGAVEIAYMDEEAVKRAGFVAGSAGAVGLREMGNEKGEMGGQGSKGTRDPGERRVDRPDVQLPKP